MIRVAARYEVSSSYLARVCARLNVPRPERGYWAKLEAGKPVRKPQLPEPRPGDELEWSKEGDSLRSKRPLPKAPSKKPRKRRVVHDQPKGTHHLLAGATAHFLKTRNSDIGYLRPYKRLLVDIYVSPQTLANALAFADGLFGALEDRGHRVTIAPADERFQRAPVDEREKSRAQRYERGWGPDRPTVVYVGSVAIGLTIFELSESVEVQYVNGKYVPVSELSPRQRLGQGMAFTWTTHRDQPTGRLCLQVYSPYARTNWQRQWLEKRPCELATKLERLAREIEREAPHIAELAAEGRRQAEEDRRRWEEMKRKWEEERIERERARALKESRDELFEIFERWVEADRLERFFEQAEVHAERLDEEARAALTARIQRARELLSSQDAIDRLRSWKAPEER